MRIAVTGADGFVGKALCPYLESHLQAEILKLTRQSQDHSGQSVSFADSDDVLINKLQGTDCIIHLAARAHTRNSTPADFLRDNVLLTDRLIKVSLKAGVPRFIYLSSIKVNGNSTRGRTPYTADESPYPEDQYGQSKLECENIIKQAFKNSQSEWIIIRPPLIYGENNKGNLASLESLIKKRIPLPFEQLHNHRDIISMSNLCQLIAVCVEHPNAANNIFLASDDISRSTKEIATLLAARMNTPVYFYKVPNWALKILQFFAPNTLERLTGDLEVDITKTKTLLNWAPSNE